ncbi:hypothetical protein OsJ_34560 [Oryza sativa Japonica Group]|uniref:Uncharacterized protein n=2 Tax=Oryza sativa subsp. japonica TaxID=39947 RepID=A0A8J8XU56_ORYSJ|nr:hypothetical protein LOC_Os11g42020 [Oryza sativa Japonica Group]EAZ19029.1 hypothetical protein OsJ_34560 [Oryza sativa Japonica Group]
MPDGGIRPICPDAATQVPRRAGRVSIVGRVTPLTMRARRSAWKEGSCGEPKGKRRQRAREPEAAAARRGCVVAAADDDDDQDDDNWIWRRWGVPTTGWVGDNDDDDEDDQI